MLPQVPQILKGHARIRTCHQLEATRPAPTAPEIVSCVFENEIIPEIATTDIGE